MESLETKRGRTNGKKSPNRRTLVPALAAAVLASTLPLGSCFDHMKKQGEDYGLETAKLRVTVQGGRIEGALKQGL